MSLALGLPTGTAAAATTRMLQLSDYEEIVTVSDPQISPAGRSIVFVASRPNLAVNSVDRQLILVDLASESEQVLTPGLKLVRFPRWSPSGDRIAFLALDTSGAPPEMQLFILPTSGGAPNKVTSSKSGVAQFAWRPDGQDIAYVTPDEPIGEDAIAAHHDGFEVNDNDYLTTSATAPSHLWLVSAVGGSTKRLTSGAWSIAKTHSGFSIEWSPDGGRLLFTRQNLPHSGDADLTTLEVLDIATKATRKVTRHSSLESFGRFSPDGSRVAYGYPRDGDASNENEIYIADAGSGLGDSVTRALDRNVLRHLWMPDGKSLLVGGYDGTRTALWLQPLGGHARRLPLGDVQPHAREWVDVSVSGGGAIAFAGSTPRHPSELYCMTLPDQAPRQVTHFNDGIARLELGETEELDWAGPNGYSEDGVVFYPPGFDRRSKAPLVVLIHGGPTLATRTGFDLLPQFLAQLLATHGYVVFAPNYRGSDNLGNAYQRAIFNDAGDGPGHDVMAGIAALEKEGFIDMSRIAVAGISYGGYMAAWLIGHYSGLKTAIVQDAVLNWLDQYNLSEVNVISRYGFAGSPYVGNNLRAYRDQSPITYFERMKTPTLIMHNTGDVVVPITQAYALYHALKDNGIPVKFVAYPIAAHVATDPVHVMDSYRLWLDWLDGHL